MVRIEDECVGCPPEMGCIGDACPYRSVPRWYCDSCKQETDPRELYRVSETETICRDCLLGSFPTVE